MKTSLPVVLTPTRTELADRCYRRHVLTDVLERGKEKNVAAAFGNVLHAGVGSVHNIMEYSANAEFRQAAIAQDTPFAAMSAEWNKQGIDGIHDKYTWEKAEVMLRAYMQQYQRVGPFTAMPFEWKVLTVEDRVRVPLGEHILSFQIDRAYQNLELRRAALIDLKTVTRPDANWKAQWYRSLQMKLYKRGMQKVYGIFDQIDFAIEGLDKNVKPKIHYVILPEWSDAMLDEAEREFLYNADRDKALIEKALMPDGSIDVDKLEWEALVNTSFNYKDCDSYGAQCAFLPLCTNEPEYRQALLHAEYKEIEADY